MIVKNFIKKSFTSTLLKNGTILNSDRSFNGDILITGEKIARVHDYNNSLSRSIEINKDTNVIDCKDRFIIPGGIDPHCHMELPFMGQVAVDDFNKGTKAAIAGGTTCIIDFISPSSDQTLKEGYDLWRKKADGKVNCDYALHCILTKWNDDIKNEMKNLLDLGVQSFKIFSAYKDALMMDDSNMYHIFSRTKELGCITMIHCENGNLIHEAQQTLLKLGITGPEGHYMSRPDSFEALATLQALTVADYVNSPIYIVHLMSKASAFEIKRAIDKGTPVFGETLAAALGADGRPTWNTDWDIAGPHVMSPPLNPDPTVKEHLMQHIHSGSIHTVGSDNCTFCLNQKKIGLNDFTKIPNGVNGIEDRMSVMWTLGVKKGHITPGEFIKATSTNAAQIFNLYPNKGIIAEGSDADVVVWNGNDERVISKNTHHQAVDHNIFEGMVVSGTAEKTFSRGNLVFDIKSGFSNLHKGKYIPRKPYGFSFDRIEERDKRLNPLNFKVNRDGLSKGQQSSLNPFHIDAEEIRLLRKKVVDLTNEIKTIKRN